MEEIDFDGEGVRVRRWWHRWWGQIMLVCALWTFIGLVFTAQYYFTAFRTEDPVPLYTALYVQMTWAYVWIPATPLVLWLVRRFPIERQNWLRVALIHLPVSIVLSVMVTALGNILLYLNYGYRAGRPFLFVRLLRFVIENFSEATGIYLLIALAGYAFSYYTRYRQGELRSSQLEAQLSQAQLQALKMQLHPHFLFNTLHSISALLNRDTEAARRMITRLGDFLRLTLENSGTQEVTLQQEMEFLKCYLEIERIRFQDRLTTEMDIDPHALETRVPNLLLQPIVENAIRHGIAPRSSTGHLNIQAKQHDGHLRIRVRDNGPGLSSGRSVESLFNKGLGLANTQKRLDRLYGAEHSFVIENAPEGGMVVTIEIPANNGQRQS
ncbi:MAG TPA: histidine kinase [Pyrinomonadaceae bacterium]|nr:histidine kinase [Pyrinomonadaceae bacterium]